MYFASGDTGEAERKPGHVHVALFVQDGQTHRLEFPQQLERGGAEDVDVAEADRDLLGPGPGNPDLGAGEGLPVLEMEENLELRMQPTWHLR
jgi:hypothetical protein